MDKLLQVRATLQAAVEELEKPGDEAQKVNWRNLVCFAIPIFNMVAPMFGLPVPPLPLPAFCTTPVPPPAS